MDVAKADKALSENLDQLYNPRHSKGPTPGQKKKLAAQNKASDFASLPDGEKLTGQPEWELRYIVKMLELDPSHIEIVENDRSHYSITVLDIEDEEMNPCPWTAEIQLSFED